jgi:methionine sulfoxide reductase heme-binding subunit
MIDIRADWKSLKILVFLLGLSPFLILLYDTLHDNLGPNPIETLHSTLGDWALRFLILTLSLTPFKQLTGYLWVNRFRRMIGLYTFFYALLHFLVYIVLDLSLSREAFVDEITESPYIVLGLITFVLLLPLAITSTKNMQKRLGKNWHRLHKLSYLAAITAVLHYIFLVKSELNTPILYADIVLILLLYRILKHTGSTPIRTAKYRYK